MKAKKHTKNRKPLVSVIMPVYNAGEFLVEAIESILRQTYQNFEFIIVDDASIDGSWEIIQKYKKLYPKKIKTIRLKRNLNKGGDACANLGFKKARGEFIARMDADDIAHPQRLEKQVEFMRQNNDVIVLGTQAFVVDREGEITGEKIEPITHEEIKQNYFIYHPMIHPTVMIRRNLLPKRSFLYRIKYSANNDLLTFFDLLRFGRFANLPEKLLFYRIHGKNDSLVNPREKFFNTIKIRFLAWMRYGYEPSLKAIIMTLLQLGVVLTMPSSIITHLYIFWRGVAKPRISLANFKYTIAYTP